MGFLRLYFVECLVCEMAFLTAAAPRMAAAAAAVAGPRRARPQRRSPQRPSRPPTAAAVHVGAVNPGAGALPPAVSHGASGLWPSRLHCRRRPCRPPSTPAALGPRPPLSPAPPPWRRRQGWPPAMTTRASAAGEVWLGLPWSEARPPPLGACSCWPRAPPPLPLRASRWASWGGKGTGVWSVRASPAVAHDALLVGSLVGAWPTWLPSRACRLRRPPPGTPWNLDLSRSLRG